MKRSILFIAVYHALQKIGQDWREAQARKLAVDNESR
jgi:hypothetical protein